MNHGAAAPVDVATTGTMIRKPLPKIDANGVAVSLAKILGSLPVTTESHETASVPGWTHAQDAREHSLRETRDSPRAASQAS